MKTECWVIGKTSDKYLQTGIDHYHKRLQHYLPFQLVVLPHPRRAGKLSPKQVKVKEGELVLSKLRRDDRLILLDEQGQQYSSEAFARFLERQFHRPHRRLIFLIGGAWGVSEAVRQRAQEELSLSAMTFSHQMVRLFFLEQLYRGMTILHNKPYHNP